MALAAHGEDDEDDKAGTEKSHPRYCQYSNTLRRIKIIKKTKQQRKMSIFEHSENDDKDDKDEKVESHPKYCQNVKTLGGMTTMFNTFFFNLANDV